MTRSRGEAFHADTASVIHNDRATKRKTAANISAKPLADDRATCLRSQTGNVVNSFSTTTSWLTKASAVLVVVIMLLYARIPEQVDSSSNIHHRLLQEEGEPSLTFAGFPLTFQSQPLYSTVHCVGENYAVDAWMYRSCQFRHLCFDTAQGEFVVFPSEIERQLQQQVSSKKNPKWFTIQSMSQDTAVALEPIADLTRPKDQLKWFPRVASPEEGAPQGFYALPDDVVWVPVQLTESKGSMWSHGLSVFTLLSIFGLLDRQPLLTHVCDPREETSCDPASMSSSGILSAIFGPENSRQLHTTRSFSATSIGPKSNLVCAKTGATGMGMIANVLADKPLNVTDTQWTQNVGRGAALREFRDWMGRRWGLAFQPVTKSPLRVTFAATKGQDFQVHLEQLQNALSKETNVVIDSFDTEDLDLSSQARRAAESAIYVTRCGEGTVPAAFLPRGACLIVFCDGVYDEDNTGTVTSRADWRVLNNAGYFRAHWLPWKFKDSEESLALLVRLIKSELGLIQKLSL